MSPQLTGIIPALTTPFEKGVLSAVQLKSNIEQYNTFGLSGYLILGSTGESILMDESERRLAIETVRAAAAEGRTVIAGAGMPSTRATIQLANTAAEAGADYALVVTPFFYKGQMTPRALEIFYREVADHSSIPIILYSVPKFTGLDLPLETIAALAEHPNIVGLKDSSGDIARLAEVLRMCPPEFAVFQGMGSVLFPSLVVGARGGILALSDMAPAETVEIFLAISEGRLHRAREVQSNLLPLNQKIVGGYGVPGIKCAMDLLGFSGGEPRPPLLSVSTESRKAIEGILIGAGLL